MKMFKIFFLCCLSLNCFAQYDLKVKDTQVEITGPAGSQTLRVRILDSLNKVVVDTLQHITVTGTFKQVITVNNPVMWSPGHPYLYKAEISLSKGKKTVIPFGFRKVTVSAKTGLLINDYRTQLKGANLITGSIAQIKAAGFNAVRITRPVSDTVFAACDRLGILVLDETGNKKHHPSIVLWGKPGHYETDNQPVPENVLFSVSTPADSFFHAWQQVRNHTYVIGDFVAADTDYINKTPYALYRDVIIYRSPIEMMVNGAASWTWPGKNGQNMLVTVYASSKKVRLTLNDELLAVKDVPDSTLTVTFEVPYRSGILAAFAITSGEETGSTALVSK